MPESSSLQLRIPGPTPVPPSVLAAMARQPINHRGPEAAAMLAEVEEGVRWGMRTRGFIALLSSSGTGGLEAAVSNLARPGLEVVVGTAGYFGDRLATIFERWGVAVHRYQEPWGAALQPERLEQVLREHPRAQVVAVTHNETSTGVTHPLRELAKVAKQGGHMLVVDAVSSASALPLEVDAWGIDICISASQKGWQTPPGMAMVAVADSAWEAIEGASGPRFYFDLARARADQARGINPWTPAQPLLFGLQEALRRLREEGLEQVWGRHARCAEAIRQGVRAMGLELLPPSHWSDAVTAVRTPAGVKASELLDELREHQQLELAGGQDRLKGEILRIGHLGWIEDDDVRAILASLHAGLTALQPRGPWARRALRGSN